ncbi:FAS-associated factor 2-like [Sinocyclocheilus grahami]|uniref:FAS-associated factor 2-like n=1 Tax=Sinocyclocheilus grahami TaxID=75366 RepID=UPI0007AD5844|nr:PREDICTED: FAS-associated factor 2-like [Sinocyclocheilus grahami]
MCQLQDQEYSASLLADREKEMRRQQLQAQEERRLKAIHERRQRMASVPEPSDGVPLRFKFPNGQMKSRKFRMSESVQV